MYLCVHNATTHLHNYLASMHTRYARQDSLCKTKRRHSATLRWCELEPQWGLVAATSCEETWILQQPLLERHGLHGTGRAVFFSGGEIKILSVDFTNWFVRIVLLMRGFKKCSGKIASGASRGRCTVSRTDSPRKMSEPGCHAKLLLHAATLPAQSYYSSGRTSDG